MFVGSRAAGAVFGILIVMALCGPALAAGTEVKIKAVEAINRKDFDAAIKLLEDASLSDLFDDEAKSLLGTAYTARGWGRADKSDFEGALEDFKKARLAEPEKKKATYLGLGYASYQLKSVDDAIYYLNEAVFIDPSESQAHELLGMIYYERGKLREARAELERAEDLKPSDHAKQFLAKIQKELSVEGSFTKRETYYFNVKYEGEEKRELGDLVLNILYKASSNVGGDLDYYPSEPINVILYTRKQFVDITDAPSWSGGIFDGNIRIPVGGGNIDEDALSAVLHHEYTHAVIHTIADGRVPTWLDEGIAQYEERWARGTKGELPAGAELMPLSAMTASFVSIGNADKAALAYAESLSAVAFFVDQYGMYNLAKLLKALGEGKKISAAMSGTAGVTLEEFETAWHESLGIR